MSKHRPGSPRSKPVHREIPAYLRPSSAADSANLLQTAIGHYRAGNHAQVIACVEALPATRQPPAALLNVAAASAMALGRRDQAEQFWRAAVRVDPGYTDAYNNLGNLLMEQNRLEEAVTSFRQALALSPNHAEAHNNLGNLLKGQRRYEEAEAAYRRALTLKPNLPETHNNLGNLFMDQQRYADAEPAYRQALALRPNYSDAHNNLCKLLTRQRRFAEAEAAYRQVLSLKPDYPEAYNNLGLMLMEQKRTGEAEVAYSRAIALRPDYPEAHNNLGILLANSQRHGEAETAYRRAVALRPGYPEAHNNLGNLFLELRRLDEAGTAYRTAIAQKPDYPEAHNNLGLMLADAQRHDEAEAAYRQALALNPGYAEAWNNLANLLADELRHEESEAAYRRAVSLRPDYPEAFTNLGLLLKDRQRYDDAIEAHRQAIALRPDYHGARWNLSFLLLTLGRLEEGWPLYEARYHPDWRQRVTNPPALPFAQWQGQDLTGKSIAILPEQGFGDEIQFARYALILKQLGARHTTLACKPALLSAFQSMADVDAVISDEDPMPPHDYWVLVTSLPGLCQTTLDSIPAEIPYLHADPERMAFWRPRLPTSGHRVGLVWKGSSGHRNDANHSLSGLSALAPLWAVPGIEFISLQKGQGEEEAGQPAADQPILHLGSEIRDFGDTAAIVAQLDLVICVDTAVAHLAGALGKPCWVLIPALKTDWRWLLDRTDSPWYPGTMRLFRQTTLRDWTGAIAEVADSLYQWVMR